MTDYVRWWQWLTSRVAVEVVRLRTRRRGRHTAETRADTRRLDDQYADQLHAIAVELEPLPQYDESIAIRERYRREAWAVTGTTEREWWASRDVVDDLVAEFEATGNLPGPSAGPHGGPSEAAQRQRNRAGEPTNVTRGYWTPRETAVDPSLAAAIRAEIDGTEHMHQYVDRLFSRINVPQIIERSFAGVSPT